MRKTLALAAIGLALVLTGCGKKDADGGNAAATAAGTEAAYSGQDWSKTVVKTAEGGFRMGKADAPVKLIEYASITCPHCRDFTKEAAEPLKQKYVRTGKISWEFRNFVLNPLDLAATLVARCQGPDTFFPFVEQLYATQADWTGKFNTVPEAELQAIGALPQEQQRLKLVEVTGLDEFFKTHGVPADRINACLTNKAGVDEVLKIMDHGQKEMKVDGTPSFFIDGEKQEGVYDWKGLEAKLRERVS
jgi:protein-disulfide isomerase